MFGSACTQYSCTPACYVTNSKWVSWPSWMNTAELLRCNWADQSPVKTTRHFLQWELAIVRRKLLHHYSMGALNEDRALGHKLYTPSLSKLGIENQTRPSSPTLSLALCRACLSSWSCSNFALTTSHAFLSSSFWFFLSWIQLWLRIQLLSIHIEVVFCLANNLNNSNKKN